jgi:hypothetical protein
MLATVATTSRTAVYLEVGTKRTFASAIEWPGWSRADRGEAAALQALAAYAPRYAPVAKRAGLSVPRITARGFDVVETVSGTATTDFGAPDAIAQVDRRRLDTASARRMVALLDAAWQELDRAVAAAPPSLRKGPRGGGRDRDAIVAHVVDAERAYARRISVRLDAAEWRDGQVALLRGRIRDALSRASDGSPAVERGWPPRYFARRTAWHALDHAWEIDDRAT